MEPSQVNIRIGEDVFEQETRGQRHGERLLAQTRDFIRPNPIIREHPSIRNSLYPANFKTSGLLSAGNFGVTMRRLVLLVARMRRLVLLMARMRRLLLLVAKMICQSG